MSNEQIEEMASVLDEAKIDALATIGSMNYGFGMWYAKALYNAGYRKQIEGRWTPRHKDTKAFCTKCGALRDIETQEFWSFCHNCGAKMKGGAE